MTSQYSADEKLIKSVYRDMCRPVKATLETCWLWVSFTQDPRDYRPLFRNVPVNKARGIVKRLEARAQALGIRAVILD